MTRALTKAIAAAQKRPLCACGRPENHRGLCFGARVRKADTGVRLLRSDSLVTPRVEPAKRDPELRDLDLAIRNGWGDTPQSKMPPDWRTRKNRQGNGGRA
jgi:hypothetical protein